MKRCLSFLLAVVLLLGAMPVTGIAAEADLPDPDVVTFEYWTTGSDLASIFASGTTMATVSSAQAKDSTKSAELKDTSASSAAILRYETEKNSFLDMSFDMFPVVGGIRFRLSNGVRSVDNTAFWIGLTNKQVNGKFYTFLEYYDGSEWIDLHQFEGTLAKKWHAVQVQAAVGSKAAVYVDGVFVAEVPRCGNGYGANVTTGINSVIFECGDAENTGANIYLDNLKLAPIADTVVETFEDYGVGDVPHFPFMDANMVSVSNAQAKDGTKSVCLADTVADQVSVLRRITGKSGALAVEFDMRPTVGAVQFRISNGIRSEANTAFYIKFANKAVNGVYYTFFQYYDGSAWVDGYQFNGALANNWHAVRVEASATGNAKVFVDSQFIGEAMHCTGTYGSKAKTEIDSVIFECGDSNNASWSYYLDNVKLAPLGPLDKDFEDAELSGSADTVPGCISNTATAVKADPINAGGKALYLSSNGGNDVPCFAYGFEFHDKYTMEFDAYIADANNTITFQLYDGRGGEDNTAYIMQFDHAYGLRVFNGSWDDAASSVWTTLNEEVKLEAGVWNKIRIEINTAESSGAVVYLNDDQVGDTDIVYYAEEPVYGIYVGTADATQSCYIDNLKMTPASYEQVVTKDPVEESFEALAANTNLATVFASGTTMATVSEAMGKDSTKSAYLADTSTTSAAFLRMQTDKSAALELDFDYNPAVGGLTLRLSNRGISTANTAFWIGFANKKGADNVYHTYFQYHNGTTWVDVYEFAGTLAGKWSSIHVEASVNGTAKVSVNGVEIGEAPRTGGTYGTSATTEMDSVIFECGTIAGTTGKLYLDNLKLVAVTDTEEPPVEESGVVEQDFEALAAGTDLTNVLASGTTMATVSEAKAKDSTKSAELYDTSKSSAAFLRMQTEKTVALELDFDYNPAVGGITFRLSNGARSDAHTAFWLGFANKKGADNVYHTYFQYYNGTDWVDVHEFAGTLANEWSAIHVEASVNGTAKVSVNGVEIGEAPRTGGTYGTSATTEMDSVIFECGAATTTGSKLYLDNVKLVAALNVETVHPEPTVEDFEAVDMTAPVEKADHHGAVIKTDPVDPAGKSLYLSDSTQTKIPYIDYRFQPCDRLALEFDVYIPTAENTITFQLYDGSRTYSNTAFFLQFNYENGLRAYNGSYSVLNANAKLKEQTWNKIRIEAVNGTSSEAKIYLNGVCVATAPAYNQKDTVNGFHIYTGSQTQSCYIDSLKANAVSVTEGGMCLVNDVAVDTLTVDAGKTLDLNGYTLNVNNLACFGSIVDTSEGNTGKLAVKDMVICDLAYMPIYDSANGCYRFFNYRLHNLGERNNADGSVTYGFAIDFVNTDAYELLSSGDCGVNVNMSLIWGGNEKTFAFSAELLRQYGALQAEHPTMQAAMMLTVTGLDTLEAGATLSVTPIVEAGGVTVAGEPMGDISGGDDTPEDVTLLQVQMGELFDIADNTETEGFPANDPYVKEDFSVSGGKYGFTQIPNAVYDPDTGLVYVNYNRHRDVVVDYPYDSTRVYNVNTLLNATANEQLQDDYVTMKTDNTMFFTAMAKLSDGRLFCQNYMTYYLTDTTATTYSWIIDTDGSWQRVEGTLTIPKKLAGSGPQSGSNWHRYGFSRCLIQLEDGTLLGSMYGTYGAIMVESKDEGKTWNYRSTIADSAIGLDQPYINTDGTAITWFEPAVTRCADGSLLCVMRTWRDKPLYQTRSYDDGLTWSKPILMPGLDVEKEEGMSIYPHLVLLSNGVLAMATGVPGDTIYFSLDGCGYNWDYGITTYSGDTTGNAAIAEIDYDEATGTVTLLALGDKGFNNKSLSGVWGRIVKVTRNHVKNPQLASAVIRSEESTLGLGDTLQVRVDAAFNSDAGLVGKAHSVQWYSLTPELATVDQTGRVTAKGVGTAQIQALVTWGGKTVTSNTLSLEIRDRDVLDSISVIASAWVLKTGGTGSLTKKAYNCFGQEFVDVITKQEYINGDTNKPKFLDADVTWHFESLDPNVLRVNAQTGSYQALSSGVTQLVATASKGNVTLTQEITMIVESNQWVTEGFESSTFPRNCIKTNFVTLSTNNAYSGSRSVYINDTSSALAPSLRFTMPESEGVVVEFMLYTENSAHLPNFGVGHPNTNGGYDYTCNTVRVGLLYNALTGAQGFQAYDGAAWSVSNRANKIPHKQWNKIRLEVTTDKPCRMYVNDVFVAELPLAADNDTLNTLYFSSGGGSYTGDAFYIDNIRYMVFD